MTKATAPLDGRDEDEWMAWLAEAHDVVLRWEEQRTGPLLSLSDAAHLAEHVARGLSDAYDRGRHATNPEGATSSTPEGRQSAQTE